MSHRKHEGGLIQILPRKRSLHRLGMQFSAIQQASDKFISPIMTPKPFAFVIMPFSDVFKDTYLLGIKPACEDAGYYCERLDEQIFEERMLDRIYNQIAKADLVIADLTERNPNVFYEVGYAHALAKRVILLTKNPDDIPFDLKHHFHIIYSGGISNLKTELRTRASYYLAHPETSTRNPFEQIILLINKKPIDWTSTVTELSVHQEYMGDNFGFARSIEACFHLRDDAIETELSLDVRLITSPEFRTSGHYSPGATTLSYPVITMLDGKMLHKPLDSVRVSLGDPDKIQFDLMVANTFAESPTQQMTLRLISCGLIRDISLLVS